MQVVRTNIGETDIFIELLDDTLEVVGEEQYGRQTDTTSVSESLYQVYSTAKSVIRTIADDIGKEMNTIDPSSRPKQVEMEFNMSLSGGTNVWILSGKANSGLKIKMTWELNQNGKKE